MKRLTFLLIGAISISFTLQAQTYDADAVRFSMIEFGSTARGLGVAGAFGSVGADFSAISINPAGLGFYTKGEFTITPNLQFSNTESIFQSNQTKKETYMPGISNLGLAFGKVKKENGFASRSGLVGGGFAIGYNRLNNFNGKTHFKGLNSSNSITDAYLAEINDPANQWIAVDFDNFSYETVLGYTTWLVNEIDSSGVYNSPVTGAVEQEGTINVSGAMDELTVAVAGNYSHKLYFGASVGVPILRYKREFDYSETDDADNIEDFRSMNVAQEYESTGWGFNAKFGLIYKPVKWIRLGASIQTPTAISLDENYSSKMTSTFDSVSYSDESPLGVFDYEIIMPWRFNSGISVFLSKYGFLSFDYEYVDYASMNYDFGIGNEDFENNVNDLMKAKYTATSNFRFGAEFAIDRFRLRAGYAFFGSPFKPGVAVDNLDLSREMFSGGFGFRLKKVFIDLAYARTKTSEFGSPYMLTNGEEPSVKSEINKDTYSLTFGYRF